MRLSRCVGLGVVAATAIAGCGRRALEQCQQAYERGDSNAGVEACARALARDSNPDTAAKLAWSLYGARKGDEARALLSRYPSDKGLPALTLATLDWRAGRTTGATQALERAASLCRDEGDSFCSARALLELSGLHYTRGNYRESLTATNRAAAEPAAGRAPNLRARALLRIFDVLYELGDAEGAERVLSAADALNAWDPPILPLVRLKQGNLLTLQERFALARDAYATAAEEASRTSSTVVAWSARLNLVKAAARDGRLEEATVQLREAEALLPQVGQSGNSALALRYHRALVLHARKQWDGALGEIDAALESKPRDDWIWELQVERARIARDAGRTAVAREACLSAIDALERMRADLGVDELKAWLLPGRRAPFEILFDLQAEAGDARAALVTAERAYARTFLDAFVAARGRGQGQSDDPAAAAVERAEAVRDFLPTLRASRVVAPAAIGDVLTGIGSARALLYFVTDRRAWLIHVAGRRVSLLRLAADAAEIQRLADRVIASPSDDAAAEALGRVLLPESVTSEGDVYVVATGGLAGIPFAALRSRGRLAVETWTFRFVPSLRALAALRTAKRTLPAAPAVLGDPAGDLPGARAESLAVARVLQVEPMVGPLATPEAMRKAAQARVLHVAAHGGIGLRGAWLGLSGGEVTGADVIRWKVHPRLVVLSSCASAAIRAREMWGSMAASFLVAGSGAVVASLWSVEDAVTQSLAERFYSEGGAVRPARALARAQRSLARSGVPASAWAAFVVLGDAT